MPITTELFGDEITNEIDQLEDASHVFTRMGPKQREAICSIRDRILGPISLFSETEAPFVVDQEPKWVRLSQRS